jgi:hypothetical protein
MSIRTIKLPYRAKNSSDSKRIFEYCKNYTNVLRFTYNRVQDFIKAGNKELPSTAQLTAEQKKMNNIFIDSHFLNSAIFEAKSKAKVPGVIFGGKKNFVKRCQGKITNQEWKELYVQPICSVGESCGKGNRKFTITSENTVLFKPSSKEHFEITLPKLRRNLKKDLLKLKELQDNKKTPITYRLDKNYIYISFENNNLEDIDLFHKVKDRVFAIDLNPNYIGWSVVDWKNSETYKVVDSGAISNKVLNDEDFDLKGKGYSSKSKKRKAITNKRNFENIDSANWLVSKAVHYKCEVFAIEDLTIQSSDKFKGSKFNKLCNNVWCRGILTKQLKKKCDLVKMHFQTVLANFSSFEGNLIYRKTGLPDMCLSSIEIGRRGYEFYHQYIIKDKEKEKNIIFDTSRKSNEAMIKSLEEFNFTDDFQSIKDLFYILKTRKIKYRVPIENSCLKSVFSKKHIKSKVYLYTF